MILDSIENLYKYNNYNSGIAKASDFLKENDLVSLKTGKYAIDGDSVFAIVEEGTDDHSDNYKLEAHHKYIDVQFCIAGKYSIGITPLKECTDILEEYSNEKDIIFFSNKVKEWISLEADKCVVLFCDDAHAPLALKKGMKKIVIKIAV